MKKMKQRNLTASDERLRLRTIGLLLSRACKRR